MFEVLARREREGVLMFGEGVESVKCPFDIWCEFENHGVRRRLLHALASRALSIVCHLSVVLQDQRENALKDIVSAASPKLAHGEQ